MVPGMAERDRLAADMRRIELLSDAVIGPSRMAYRPGTPSNGYKSRPVPPPGIWRRGFAWAQVLGQCVRLMRPGTSLSRPRNAAAPVR
jgi:hypothetical protein